MISHFWRNKPARILLVSTDWIVAHAPPPNFPIVCRGHPDPYPHHTLHLSTYPEGVVGVHFVALHYLISATSFHHHCMMTPLAMLHVIGKYSPILSWLWVYTKINVSSKVYIYFSLSTACNQASMAQLSWFVVRLFNVWEKVGENLIVLFVVFCLLVSCCMGFPQFTLNFCQDLWEFLSERRLHSHSQLHTLGV